MRRSRRKPLYRLPDLKEIRDHEKELAEESDYDYDGLGQFRTLMRRISPERVDHGDEQRTGKRTGRQTP